MSTVFITGANRGLGLEFVKQYADAGWRVLASCRDVARAGELKSLKGTLELIQLDVTDHAAIEKLAEDLSDDNIDILINNAGVLLDYGSRLGNIDHAAVSASFEINAFAPLKICECFTDHVARSEMKVMTAITSRLASIEENTSGGGYAYRASKAALNALMRGVAGDLAGRGVTVAMFHPGWVRTRMGGRSAAVDPADSVRGIRSIIAELGPEQSGTFLSYDGEVLPW
ncbi:MAG: SDR family oxidoreductase [Rhodospirillales bacterium]|jgi:NAD(P)-dependent dehydrogenase (short-subunit alcohol dehydrogenase family)|nr:short-chain dehydrogenase [Rhodospirillaceae bacterium]MDP6430380.1 SDR family oxidoreductase [Rhodospirillales bacterium]MDP6646680.1 SDR family oxidoreductase [Rhodospirillales bacterium]|tara:strand:- start:2058 stop:2741 length:684 start_codon:yes stop_codon:yes gene_type:complete